MTSTIYARATGAGRAAVVIVRVSGPEAGAMLEALAGGRPQPRAAALRTLRDAAGGVLDHALVLWFPGPASFTGEDLFELHLHGGSAVVEAVAAALRAAGAAPAEPGAFTRRAFANGKLDLTQAEAIADLVDAETEAQRIQAQRQLEGALGALYQDWRSALLDVAAALEAAIDFPDEEDVPADVANAAPARLAALEADMAAHLADERRGRAVRDGVRIALIGAPNAGKSTLFNALLERDAAIVTEIPGTTRDVVEGRLVLGGVPANLADTAGLRSSADPIETEGVRRAEAAADEADIRIWVIGPGDPEPPLGAVRADDVIWRNKTDLDERPRVATRTGGRAETLHGSAREGTGLDHLRSALERRAAQIAGVGDGPGLTRLRHRDGVERARAAVARARSAYAQGPELAAEDVRAAAQALGRITGRVDVEEILDRIFADFCIGK